MEAFLPWDEFLKRFSLDNGAPDDWVQISGSLWVYKYEASRPNATVGDSGSQSHRVCSRVGVKPWTNVTQPEAEMYQDGLLETGARTSCYADHGSGDQVFDMSGNLKEWTKQRSEGGIPCAAAPSITPRWVSPAASTLLWLTTPFSSTT